jgi:hypothetical protein
MAVSTADMIGKLDRDAVRDALREVLQSHDLDLEQIQWTENLRKGELKLSLKIGGDLHRQIELPFGDGEGDE